MIALEAVVQGKLMTFREFLVYLEFRLVSTVRHDFFYRASRRPITGVEFKFVASVVIRTAKLNFLQKVELESTSRNMLPQLETLCFAVRH